MKWLSKTALLRRKRPKASWPYLCADLLVAEIAVSPETGHYPNICHINGFPLAIWPACISGLVAIESEDGAPLHFPRRNRSVLLGGCAKASSVR